MTRYYDGKGEAASGLTPMHGRQYNVRADISDAGMTPEDANVGGAWAVDCPVGTSNELSVGGKFAVVRAPPPQLCHG